MNLLPEQEIVRRRLKVAAKANDKSMTTALKEAGLGKNYLNQPLDKASHPYVLRCLCKGAGALYLDLLNELGTLTVADIKEGGWSRIRARGHRDAVEVLDVDPVLALQSLQELVSRKAAANHRSICSICNVVGIHWETFATDRKKPLYPDFLRKVAAELGCPYLELALAAQYVTVAELEAGGWRSPHHADLSVELAASRKGSACSRPPSTTDLEVLPPADTEGTAGQASPQRSGESLEASRAVGKPAPSSTAPAQQLRLPWVA
jgi:hypothetical protein